MTGAVMARALSQVLPVTAIYVRAYGAVSLESWTNCARNGMVQLTVFGR